MSAEPLAPAAPARALWWGAGAAALLMVAGAGAFAVASMRAGGAASVDGVTTVTLREGACEPNSLSVPAGRTTFRIVNRTTRAVEWEILDGVMVVEERENIAPDLSQTLTARLAEGSYAITCGLLSNPRGVLTVTAASGPGAPNARPELAAFIGPLAEYQVFLTVQGGAIARRAEALNAAVRAGDLEAARAAWREAVLPYARTEAVSGRFADLRERIAPSARYLAAGEDDPAFSGYRRIEQALFERNTLAGLEPVTQQLVDDAALLRDRLRAARVKPDEMAQGAVRALRAIADVSVPAGISPYAGDDLAEFEAGLAGSEKVAVLLRPLGETAAPTQTAAVAESLVDLRARFAALKGPQGFPPYREVAPDSREALAQALRALADRLDHLNGALGLGEQGA